MLELLADAFDAPASTQRALTRRRTSRVRGTQGTLRCGPSSSPGGSSRSGRRRESGTLATRKTGSVILSIRWSACLHTSWVSPALQLLWRRSSIFHTLFADSRTHEDYLMSGPCARGSSTNVAVRFSNSPISSYGAGLGEGAGEALMSRVAGWGTGGVSKQNGVVGVGCVGWGGWSGVGWGGQGGHTYRTAKPSSIIAF